MCGRWAPGEKVSALIASHCGHEFEQTLGDRKDREAWRAAVHGVARSWTQLHDRTTKKTVSICCHRRVWWPFFVLISLHSQGWRDTFAVSRRFGVTSLVAQWLRIHVPMQGHGFNPSSWKIPHAAGQRSLRIVEPVLGHERSHRNEKPARHTSRTASAHHNQKKPSHRNEDAAQSKNKLN